MHYPNTIEHTSSIFKDDFPALVDIIESGRTDILNLWMSDYTVADIFEKFRSDSGVLEHAVGVPILDAFVYNIKNEKSIQSQSDMIHFFIYLKNQDIEIDGLMYLCNALKMSIISYVMPRTPLDEITTLKSIHEVFDNYVRYVLTYFTTTICHLLEKYKLATDYVNTVVIGDVHDTIIYVNNEACRLSLYTRDEMLGNHQNIMTHPDMTEEIMPEILQIVRSNKVWKGIIKNKTKEGNPYWIKTTVVPIMDANGEMIEYISIGSDITDTYLAEEELKKSVLKLQDLDEKKNEFINIASHELRTPMTAISGYLSMILDGEAGEITAETRKYLEQVFKSSKQLITLINDMLDIARLESGRGKLYYEDIEMHAFLEEVVDNLRPLAILKDQTVELCIDYDELFYRTDNRKCQQVLVNIIGNALKYTPLQGKITIHSWTEDMILCIRVEDTGMGIPKKHLGKIFEKFSQVKNSLTRDINGTGLGLAITKTIIEKFFGTIDVESTEGKGSIFTIRLPLEKED